jgi:hypothetical protein
MESKSDQVLNAKLAIEQRICSRIEHLGPIRDALKSGRWKVDEVGYMASGERAAVLLAAKLESELESPLFTFLRLDDDLQAFVLVSRERTDLVGTRIACI